jgi:hypothetical protein
MDDRYTRNMEKLPVVPYREPEAWVPSGGFSPIRSEAEQEEDARIASELETAEEPPEPPAEG